MDFTEKRILGRTGLKVSRLGLAGGYGIPATGVERAFHEHGINYFYWSTPRKPGMRDGLRNLIKNHRDEIVIVVQSYDHIGWTVERSVHKGLKTLNIDFIDVILLGWQNWNPPGRVISKLLKMKAEGKIRHIAMSGHNRKLFGELAQKPGSPIDIFMIRYNAAHPGAENDIFPHLSENSRPGVTVYTATSWGKLLKQKKMPPGEKPLTAADCYRFVLSNPDIDLCMMGPRNEREFDEGVKALKLGPLSDQEMARARKIGAYVHG
jgi:aryl-alcohol dehydrogenase-like predicted oxidoreductase